MQHQGGPEYAYRLRISPPRPDFELRVVPSSVSARAGSTVPLTVYVLRKDGFAGEITLSLKDAPEGFWLAGRQVPATANELKVTLGLPSTSPQEPVSLQLEGRTTVQGREVAQPVVPAEDMMQAFAYRHLVPSQELRVAVSGRDFGRSPVRLLGDGPTRIPVGGTASVKFAVPKSAPLDRIQLALRDPPEGISIRKIARSGEGIEILIQTDAAKVKAGQKGNLILTAAAKRPGTAGNKSKPLKPKAAAQLTLPAVPYEIVAP
jgi:hypothetical protein